MRACLLGIVLGGCDPTFRQVGIHTGDLGGPTGGSGAPESWHCDRRELDGRCIDYVGEGWDAGSRTNDCGSKAQPGGCPASDLGGCTLGIGTPLVRTEWYYVGAYYGPKDDAFLEGSCKQNFGEWSAAR